MNDATEFHLFQVNLYYSTLRLSVCSFREFNNLFFGRHKAQSTHQGRNFTTTMRLQPVEHVWHVKRDRKKKKKWSLWRAGKEQLATFIRNSDGIRRQPLSNKRNYPTCSHEWGEWPGTPGHMGQRWGMWKGWEEKRPIVTHCFVSYM